jgi:hypothetical protein
LSHSSDSLALENDQPYEFIESESYFKTEEYLYRMSNSLESLCPGASCDYLLAFKDMVSQAGRIEAVVAVLDTNPLVSAPEVTFPTGLEAVWISPSKLARLSRGPPAANRVVCRLISFRCGSVTGHQASDMHAIQKKI